MTIEMNEINAKQNNPEFLGLLKAADAAYMYARGADFVRTAVTIVSLIIAIVAAVRSDVAEPLAVAGAAGVVINEVIRRLGTARWTKQAMLFQERFDTSLYELPWQPTVGHAPKPEDRHYWEQRFRGDLTRKQDWYVDVAGLPRGHAILICQRENLSWDARLRGLWGSILLAAAFAWVVIGLVIGVMFDWRVWDLLVRWLAPSAPALVLAFTSGSRHLEVAQAKRALIDRVEDLLGSAPILSLKGQKRLIARARECQDEIARLRAEESRVPDLVYRSFRTEDEKAAASAAKYWRDRLRQEMDKPTNRSDVDDTKEASTVAPNIAAGGSSR
jgi:hypothetical protein